MEKLLPPSSKAKEGSPMIFLRGENLEYYRNIEYLKEVTHQANALLDRSNARYENILDDQKLGYRVRGRSNSDSTKSIPLETEGKCKKCGLAHGAANFCIVERIMDDEKQTDDTIRKFKLSKGSMKSSMSVESRSLKQQPDLVIDKISVKKPQEKNTLENVNILQKMSPSQVLYTYELLCARYGKNAGQRFLLANSLAHSPERKIEQWTTPSERHPKIIPELSKKTLPRYDDISRKCPNAAAQEYDFLCPDVSLEVRQKMEQLVHLVPPCQGRPLDSPEKNWRAVFRKHPAEQDDASSKGEVWDEQTDLETTVTDESCKCRNQQCTCGTEKVCTTPKVEKKCVISEREEAYENNYLLTVRKQIWERRKTKRKETRLFSRPSSALAVQTRTRSKQFLDKARVEQYETLRNCLADSLKNKEYDQQEFDKNVQEVSDMTCRNSAINPRQWDRWFQQMKDQQKMEERDEIDSLPSNIDTDQENDSTISHSTRVDWKPGRIKSSRIPYAEDIYDLIDNLYDKIAMQFETSIRKNSFKTSRLSYRPTYAFLHHRMTLLSCQSQLFHDIMALAKFPSYPKRLTPFRVRKMRKIKRLQALQRATRRKKEKRGVIRGLQLGKQYRKISQSYKYAPGSGYIGFKPRERKVLDSKEPDRFAKFNLVEDPQGKAITTKTIHHDFRLMSRMFEHAAKENREDLMDQGMLERLNEFKRKMYNVQQLPSPPMTDLDTEDEEDSDFIYRSPPKEDIQLLQKANGVVYSKCRTLTKQMSCENVPGREEMRRTKQLGAEKSNSTEKLKTSEKPSCNPSIKKIKNEHGKAQKSTSSTNVKGEKMMHRDRIKWSKVDTNPKQNLQMRSSIKSLTNLLPPLKGPTTKSMLNNEFEETISSLQNELCHLLNQQSHVQKSKSAKKTNDTKTSRTRRRNSVVTKLPELTSRKTYSKNSTRKISDELPHIKQRESVENLKPGHSQEKLPKKGLVRKTSMLNLRCDNAMSFQLPRLVENQNSGSCASNESENRRSASRGPRIKISTIPKKTSFKAWR